MGPTLARKLTLGAALALGAGLSAAGCTTDAPAESPDAAPDDARPPEPDARSPAVPPSLFADLGFVEADAETCDLRACGRQGEPSCDGRTAVVPAAATQCVRRDGEASCTWPPPERVDCAAEGRLCQAGRCVGAGPPTLAGVGADTFMVVSLALDADVPAADQDGDGTTDNAAAEILARFAADLREDIVGRYLSLPLVQGSGRLLVHRLPDGRGALLGARVRPEDGALIVLRESFLPDSDEPAAVFDADGAAPFLPLTLPVGDARLTLHLVETRLERAPEGAVLTGRLRLADFGADLDAWAEAHCACLGLGDTPLIAVQDDGALAGCEPTRGREQCNGDDFNGRPDEYVCQRLGDDCGIIVRRMTPDLQTPGGPAISLALGFSLAPAVVAAVE